MKSTIVVALMVWVIGGCGKSAEQAGREQAEAEAAKAGSGDKLPAPPPVMVVVDAAIDTTAADQALIAACDSKKLDEPKDRLACALAACRQSDKERAINWAKSLPKDLKLVAMRTCIASKIVL